MRRASACPTANNSGRRPARGRLECDGDARCALADGLGERIKNNLHTKRDAKADLCSLRGRECTQGPFCVAFCVQISYLIRGGAWATRCHTLANRAAEYWLAVMAFIACALVLVGCRFLNPAGRRGACLPLCGFAKPCWSYPRRMPMNRQSTRAVAPHTTGWVSA